jgi:hypothetical protein
MNSVSNKQIESEVLNAFKGLTQAAESLDSASYFEFFDREKFSGLNADGRVWHDFKNLEDLINAGFPMIQKSLSLVFDNVKVTVINPTTAILVNEYKQSILLKDGNVIKQSGGGTQVWSKSDNGWQLVNVSASESKE